MVNFCVFVLMTGPFARLMRNNSDIPTNQFSSEPKESRILFFIQVGNENEGAYTYEKYLQLKIKSSSPYIVTYPLHSFLKDYILQSYTN